MSNLTSLSSKLTPKSFSISGKSKNVFLGVTGFSLIMIGKAELDKQASKQVINLKKERLSMVDPYPNYPNSN
jgi:hypothetical protein